MTIEVSKGALDLFPRGCARVPSHRSLRYLLPFRPSSVDSASQSAIERIEALGGTIRAVYYNRLGLRVLLKPHKFDPNRMPRFARPTAARDLAYYRSPEHRGYLADEAKEASA